MAELDPQAQALVAAAASSGLPPVYTLPPQEARERMRSAFINGEPEPIKQIVDLVIPGPLGGLPVRVYRPDDRDDIPVVLFFHGGGWTVNDLDTHDRLCSLLSRGAGAVVISVDHRRSPEHKYPAPVEDAYAALLWVVSNSDELGVDVGALAVAGDSSGGTIATVLAMLSRDRRGPAIACQLLMYPVTDYPDPLPPSYIERGTGYSLNHDFMDWSWRNYLPAEWSRDDVYLCPLRGNLAGLPRTLLLTAEFDPLRDEGAAYGARLATSGVSVDHWHLEDQMHGFAMQTRAITRAAAVVGEASRWLGRALDGAKAKVV
ncbi:alpha/beta hydrolase [Micromonospora sp. PSH03]|uniref:alpha/beta hydrolase n=1 Tax=Micromonospora TaxID=1873 RepID=UPI001B359003|nr:MULTISPECIES: alpha/beta hydrolase [Micromonospora]MBQ0991670.1 alpha/beta hydrolase [Micromonospora sp. H61]MCG5460105.1 alpha/beta hydrolase [Micromonospora salmantinae]